MNKTKMQYCGDAKKQEGRPGLFKKTACMLIMGAGITMAPPLISSLHGDNRLISRQLPGASCETNTKSQRIGRLSTSETEISAKFEFGSESEYQGPKKGYGDYIRFKSINCSLTNREINAEMSSQVRVSITTTEKSVDRVMNNTNSETIAGYEFRVHSINCDDKIVTFRVFDSLGNELSMIDVSDSMNFKYSDYDITIGVSDFVKGLAPSDTTVRNRMDAVTESSGSESKAVNPSIKESLGRIGTSVEFKKGKVKGEIMLKGLYKSRTESYTEVFSSERMTKNIASMWVPEMGLSILLDKMGCGFIFNRDEYSAFLKIGSIEGHNITIRSALLNIATDHIIYAGRNSSIELQVRNSIKISKRMYLRFLKLIMESSISEISFQNGIASTVSDITNPSGSTTNTVRECDVTRMKEDGFSGGVAGEIDFTPNLSNKVIGSFVINSGSGSSFGLRFVHWFKVHE